MSKPLTEGLGRFDQSVDKVKLRSVSRRSPRAVADLQPTLVLCNTISDPRDIAYKTNKRSDASKHRINNRMFINVQKRCRVYLRFYKEKD